MMRLLRLTHSMNPAGGGVAEAIRQFGLAARAHEVDLTVVTLDAPTAPWLIDLPFKVVALGPCRNGYGYSPDLIPWLKAKTDAFDTAIIDGLWQYHGWATYRVFNGKIPYFVMPHGMLDPWFKQQYPLKHLKKWLYWPWAEYRIIRDARAVVFTAEEERRKARQSFWLYKTKEEPIAPLGIKKPTYDSIAGQSIFAEAVPRLGSAPYLIFLGRLHEKKGVDLLIRAYKRFTEGCPESPWHLVLAGPAANPVFQNELEALTRSIPKIHFTGVLQGDSKWAALASAEALILPSHQENFGLVVAEALALGTPVLISKQIDIWREIVEKKAGLAEDDTEAGTFALLQRYRGVTPQEKQNMRIQAAHCFAKNFEVDTSVRRLISLLR